MKPEKENRDTDRYQRKKYQGDHVAGKHVGIEAHGERQHTRQVADDLDGDHADGQRPHGSHEMLQIRNAVMSEPLGLVVDEGADGTSERDPRHSRGRFKAWNEADQIADQDEKGQGQEKGSEALAMMSDNFLALALDETMSAFKDV